MATINQAISAARMGRQSHISVIGHTDTDENSEPLSLRRAKAVEAALIGQGARAEAITVSGAGKDDLAVQTADHVKEPRNRRVVISLEP
jgi:outer membrane protein OmpA-like peptidoglycan-associated protein